MVERKFFNGYSQHELNYVDSRVKDIVNLMEEYATIKSQESFEDGKNLGHAMATGQPTYGLKDKDTNFEDWL